MAGVFKLLDDILLSEDVKVDEGICGLEGDSEVTHFHGGDVMEEVRAEGGIQREVGKSLLHDDFGIGYVGPLYGYPGERIACTPASRSDEQVLVAFPGDLRVVAFDLLGDFLGT